MESDRFKVAWNIMIELRKEVIETQKIRAQVIGFKITFVSTSIAVIIANIDKIPVAILVIPALASIFFDLLINSYSFGIKRIGFYCRKYLEPIIRSSQEWSDITPLWEEFVSSREARQSFSFIGNLGITTLAIVPATVALLSPFRWAVSSPLLFLLILLFTYDVVAFRKSKIIAESGLKI